MKKMTIAAMVLLSSISFAETNIICGIYEKGETAGRMQLDIDVNKDFKKQGGSDFTWRESKNKLSENKTLTAYYGAGAEENLSRAKGRVDGEILFELKDGENIISKKMDDSVFRSLLKGSGMIVDLDKEAGVYMACYNMKRSHVAPFDIEFTVGPNRDLDQVIAEGVKDCKDSVNDYNRNLLGEDRFLVSERGDLYEILESVVQQN